MWAVRKEFFCEQIKKNLLKQIRITKSKTDYTRQNDFFCLITEVSPYKLRLLKPKTLIGVWEMKKIELQNSRKINIF